MEYLRKILPNYTQAGEVASKIVLNVGLVLCLQKCFEFYFSAPTYTDIALVEQHEAEFPALTFCPDSPDLVKLKEDVLKVEISYCLFQFNFTFCFIT